MRRVWKEIQYGPVPDDPQTQSPRGSRKAFKVFPFNDHKAFTNKFSDYMVGTPVSNAA